MACSKLSHHHVLRSHPSLLSLPLSLSLFLLPPPPSPPQQVSSAQPFVLYRLSDPSRLQRNSLPRPMPLFSIPTRSCPSRSQPISDHPLSNLRLLPKPRNSSVQSEVYPGRVRRESKPHQRREHVPPALILLQTPNLIDG